MTIWRFIETPPLPGVVNMAIDAAILSEHAKGNSPPTLRLYRWSPAAISLGYFQRRHEFDPLACSKLGVDIVRRPTGGKAILHGSDLCYSVVAGTKEGFPQSVTAAYETISHGIQAGLRLLGVETSVAAASERSAHADLCFLRTTPGALLHKGKKLAGSAQTWQGHSLLQHGSISIDPDVNFLLQLLGEKRTGARVSSLLSTQTTSLKEVLGYTPDAHLLSSCIVEGMSSRLGLMLIPGKLSNEELSQCEGLGPLSLLEKEVCA